jgi:putative tricarboxylic transport membrane protein
MPATRQAGEGRRPRLFLGLGIAALGIFIGIEAASITVAPSYARIGPTFFPWIVGSGLFVIGAVLTWSSYTGQWAPEGQDEPVDPGPLALVAAGLALQAALMTTAGFIVASSVLFCFTTRAFGSRKIARDIALALLVSALTYAAFTFGLGLALPAGPLTGIF